MTRPLVDDYLLFNLQADLVLLVLALISLGIFAFSARWQHVGPALKALRPRAFWIVLVPLALLLRVPLLAQSLWYDEAFTKRLVDIPLQNFIPALMGDVHPPGHYLLARLSVSIFGMSDVALRLPSLVAGMAMIYLVYRLALLLHNDRASAQLAAAITALLPAMLYYSTEARYPVLLACAVLLSLIALLSDRPRLFAVVTGLAAWFHSVGMVYVGLLVIVALAKRQPRWIAAGLVAAAVGGAWLPGLLSQSSDVADGFWLVDAVPLWHLLSMTLRRAVPTPEVLPLLWSTPLLLTLFGLWTARRWIAQRPAWVVIALVLPALLWAIGLVWHPVYLARALIAPALLMVITWAWYLTRSTPGWRVVVAGALVASIVLGLGELYSTNRADGVDEMLRLGCNGADYVYTTSTDMTVTAMALSQIPVVSWVGGNNLNQTLPLAARRAMQFNFHLPELRPGEVCMVMLLTYFTTDAELNRVNEIRNRYQPRLIMEHNRDNLFQYIVWRFHT